jgi:succinate dehydrogenase/fumarate reductase flavoprotein subunit
MNLPLSCDVIVVGGGAAGTAAAIGAVLHPTLEENHVNLMEQVA